MFLVQNEVTCQQWNAEEGAKMIKKTFIKAQDLLDDSFRLGLQIIRDGFHPDYIVGIWRGGSPIAIAVQELLSFHGFPSDHIAVRTSSYCGIEKQRDQVQVQGLQYIIDNVTAVNSLLIVDDVFDSGRSSQELIDKITRFLGDKTPNTIRIATVYHKPKNRKVSRVPDYFVRQTDHWLVFPHELQGLTEEEVATHKPLALFREAVVGTRM